jgi:OmpA-OmpF porin, OOP family
MFKRIALATLASLGFLTGSAYAAEGMTRYSGIALGQVGVKAGNFDETDTGYKFFGGLMFNKNFGVELAYMDGAAPKGPLLSSSRSQTEISPSAFTIEGIASIPLGEKFAVYGKVGIAFYDVYIQNIGGDSGNDIVYGAGLSLGLGKKFELRAEWEQFGFDYANGSGDVSMISLGGVFKF